MTYEIDIDPQARDQLQALPAAMLPAFAEVTTLLQLTPWAGAPYVMTNPDGNIRRLTFGPGGTAQVIYLILDDQQRVDVLKVMWLD